MSTPLVHTHTSTRVPTGLLVASTLCWIWGIVCGFSGFALFLPVAKMSLGSGAIIVALVFAVVAVDYCVAGYLIRKGRLAGGWIGLISAGIVAALQLFGIVGQRSISMGASVGLAINVAIVLLVGLNWRHLSTSRARVGA